MSREENEVQGAKQNVVAVDSNDVEQRVVDRLEAHTGDGIRHRAFTCLLFDEQRRLMLAQRSPSKRLWGGYWDGTVASHPKPDESQVEATQNRLEVELGIKPNQYENLIVTDKFEYKSYYMNAGLEWEVCTVLEATLIDTKVNPDPEEITGILWVDYEDMQLNPLYYRQLDLCPWLEIAMYRDFNKIGI
ncbi:MAG: NUDIX domain-containing protein [Halobacteriales archaeon]|nr:NUDIX domain-containing protein [Halobacteriales archaeon]